MANPALLWGSLDRPFKQGFVLDDDQYMDRVQHLSVTGDGNRLLEEPERILTTNRKIKKTKWSPSREEIVAKTGLGFFVWRQTATVAFARPSPQYSELWVCSQVPQLLDYGINRRNLRWFSDALAQSGFGVTASPVETSWRKSTRPVPS